MVHNKCAGRRVNVPGAGRPAKEVIVSEPRTLTARPTTYNGVAMRSRLEARYAAWLDSQHIAWEYEPQCFASSAGQYLPDFKVAVRFAGAVRTVYIEVKPTWALTPDDGELLRRASVIWASEPDALLVHEIAECDHPIVMLPDRWGFQGAVDCHWIASDLHGTHLGFVAHQAWREWH